MEILQFQDASILLYSCSKVIEQSLPLPLEQKLISLEHYDFIFYKQNEHEIYIVTKGDIPYGARKYDSLEAALSDSIRSIREFYSKEKFLDISECNFKHLINLIPEKLRESVTNDAIYLFEKFYSSGSHHINIEDDKSYLQRIYSFLTIEEIEKVKATAISLSLSTKEIWLEFPQEIREVVEKYREVKTNLELGSTEIINYLGMQNNIDNEAIKKKLQLFLMTEKATVYLQ